jgi:5-methylcytosine-specific restriction protein A
MAKTTGQGNPIWMRDQIILALDLYFKCDGQMPSPADARVVALSKLLRNLPHRIEVGKRKNFRNPDGVAFKLQNLRQLATGNRLGKVSRNDSLVWQEFGGDPARVQALAKAVVAGSVRLDAGDDDTSDDEDEEFVEGRILTTLHKRRERAKGLRRALIKVRRAKGTLKCDICALSERIAAPELGDALFEAHHDKTPVSDMEDGTTTRVRDLCLLCACCHRLIHRAISRQKRWLSVTEARAALRVGNKLAAGR